MSDNKLNNKLKQAIDTNKKWNETEIATEIKNDIKI